jgi:hypothetical protein
MRYGHGWRQNEISTVAIVDGLARRNRGLRAFRDANHAASNPNPAAAYYRSDNSPA